MSGGSGYAAIARPVRKALREAEAAADLLEFVVKHRSRELAAERLWQGARQAEADIMKLLGTHAGSDAPDFPMTATPGDPAAAVAVIGEAESILGTKAAEGPGGEHAVVIRHVCHSAYPLQEGGGLGREAGLVNQA